MNIVKGQGMPDFTMLDNIENEDFLTNLQTRFSKKQIYTYIGEQIVAMNPFTSCDIYTKEVMKKYQNRYMYEVQPHIYALADDTFRLLTQDQQNQCVLITGESGAGKTEASKIFMQYIVMVCGTRSLGRGVPGEAEAIKQHLLDSNPVLEAFGNAKTLRNDNSSRFGKYMEIQFNGGGTPLGGTISQYLLEKSRVVVRAQQERSFHIFYQMLTDRKLVTEHGLGTPDQFQCLYMSQCYTVSTINDREEFEEVKRAMEALGFSAQNMSSVWRILAAILHLSNILFTPEKGGESSSVDPQTQGSFDWAASLLSMEAQSLTSALTERDIETAGRVTMVPLNPKQATAALNSMCTALYTKVFDLVVSNVNNSLQGNVEPDIVIGVLDIYGFEIFEKNSFEQFCINYCNEKLQQLFINLVLKQEQDEYEKEGIEWNPIPFFNNQPIIDLIEKRGGILKLLDDACLFGSGNPADFLQSMNKAFPRHEFYQSACQSTPEEKKASAGRPGGMQMIGSSSAKGAHAGGVFRITHYAGVVDYDVSEFLDKNRDTLNRTIKQACCASHDPILTSFYPERQTSKKRPVSAGTQFKASVNDLVQQLLRCQPHYIRCIKSNDKKQAFGFDRERVAHQVNYLNLVETVRVRRAGFCNRQPYARFLPRYKMLCAETWPHWNGSDRDGCEQVVKSLGIHPSEYRLGNSKIFIKSAATLTKLEETRNEKMNHVACAIQRHWRVLRIDSKITEVFDSNKPYVFLGPQSFKSDYLPEQEKLKYQTCIKPLFAANGDQDVKFSKHICKITRRGAKNDRVLVVSNLNVYILHPKTFACKWMLSLRDLVSLAMTGKDDGVIVLKGKAPLKDRVLDMGAGIEMGTGVSQLVELVYVLRLQTACLVGKEVECTFDDLLHFNITRTPKSKGVEATMEFSEGATKNNQVAISGGGKTFKAMIPPTTGTNTQARAYEEEKAGQPVNNDEELLNAFGVFDASGNGNANSGELRYVLTNLGERLSEDEVLEMLAEADPTNSGVFNYRHFVSVMGKKPAKSNKRHNRLGSQRSMGMGPGMGGTTAFGGGTGGAVTRGASTWKPTLNSGPTYTAGQKVKALFEDGQYYPAMVQSVNGTQYGVAFDGYEGDMVTLPGSSIMMA